MGLGKIWYRKLIVSWALQGGQAIVQGQEQHRNAKEWEGHKEMVSRKFVKRAKMGQIGA